MANLNKKMKDMGYKAQSKAEDVRNKTEQKMRNMQPGQKNKKK